MVSAGSYANLHLTQTDNHASTHHSVFTGRMPFLLPNQQHSSTPYVLYTGNQGLLYLLYPPSLADILFSSLSVCLSVCLCVRTHLNGRHHVLLAEKCIQLVHEKLRIFPYGNISLESMFHWLSDDTVKFKIKVRVEEKCTKIVSDVLASSQQQALMRGKVIPLCCHSGNNNHTVGTNI